LSGVLCLRLVTWVVVLWTGLKLPPRPSPTAAGIVLLQQLACCCAIQVCSCTVAGTTRRPRSSNSTPLRAARIPWIISCQAQCILYTACSCSKRFITKQKVTYRSSPPL
jgi:hypothetical protein